MDGCMYVCMGIGIGIGIYIYIHTCFILTDVYIYIYIHGSYVQNGLSMICMLQLQYEWDISWMFCHIK